MIVIQTLLHRQVRYVPSSVSFAAKHDKSESRRNRAVPVSLSYLVDRKSPEAEPEDSSEGQGNRTIDGHSRCKAIHRTVNGLITEVQGSTDEV